VENLGINQGRINSLDYNIIKISGNLGAKENGGKVIFTENFQEQKTSEEEVDKSVKKLNKFLEDEKVHVEYEVHDKLNQLMIKIVDDEKRIITFGVVL